MDKEIYLIFGTMIGAFVAYLTAKITTKAQLYIARLNAKKDISLQFDRLHEDRTRQERELERSKLDILHRTLSRIALENSQTMSYMQSDENISIAEFRRRYLDNCDRLHEALAIVDIYYPQMGKSMREIYGKSNVFWGYQENLLRIDIKKNHEGWQAMLSEVLKAGEAIGTHSRNLRDEIANRAILLSESAKGKRPN